MTDKQTRHCKQSPKKTLPTYSIDLSDVNLVYLNTSARRYEHLTIILSGEIQILLED